MPKETERRPYNPHALAGGYAALTLPDRKTAFVFSRLCAHAGWTGNTTLSILGLMDETKFSHGAVSSAIETLKNLGRITKKPRGIGGQQGGRQTAVTTVYCTEQELRDAGASEENYFGKGGKAGLFKVQNAPIQSPKRAYSKSKAEAFKVQRVGLEPFESAFPSLPGEREPLQKNPGEKPASPPQGKKENQNQPREAAGKGSLPPEKPPVADAAAIRPAIRCRLKDEVAAKLRAAGCPPKVLGMLEGYTKMATILNGDAPDGCSNPVAAYAKFARNNPKFGEMWTPTLKDGSYDDEDAMEAENTRLQKASREAEEAKLTPEERQRRSDEEDAMCWWAGLTMEQVGKCHVRSTFKDDGFGNEVGFYNHEDILAAYMDSAEKKFADKRAAAKARP